MREYLVKGCWRTGNEKWRRGVVMPGDNRYSEMRGTENVGKDEWK